MGAVYEAIDLQLGRSVALKLMRPGAAGHETGPCAVPPRGAAAAQLEHDHIVPIYQVGEDNGVPYLAMPLLHGQTLDERLKRRTAARDERGAADRPRDRRGPGRRARRGLIHRDIKPANVWLEEGSGRVKILDFGLARAADETARLTQDGSDPGHARVHGPRAGQRPGPVDSPQRPVQPGVRPLPDGHRQAAVPREQLGAC